MVPICAKIVIELVTQKVDPSIICTTAGYNLVQYPGELTTKNSDLVVSCIQALLLFLF